MWIIPTYIYTYTIIRTAVTNVDDDDEDDDFI